MLSDRAVKSLSALLFSLSLISWMVAAYLKNYIITHERIWAGRSDLVQVELFGNFVAPRTVCYSYEAACILGIVFISALGLFHVKRH
jgi:hypothetical protein